MATIYDSRKPETFALSPEDFAQPDLTPEEWLATVTPIESYDKDFCRELALKVGVHEDDYFPGNYFFILTRTSKKRVVLELFEDTVEKAGYCIETGSKIWEPITEKVFTMIAPYTSAAMIAAVETFTDKDRFGCYTQSKSQDTPW